MTSRSSNNDHPAVSSPEEVNLLQSAGLTRRSPKSVRLGWHVKIRLNGEPAEVPDAVTIEQLLERLGIDPRLVAVEHNLTIIKRHLQAETVVNEGDEVEIVNFVGGG